MSDLLLVARSRVKLNPSTFLICEMFSATKSDEVTSSFSLFSLIRRSQIRTVSCRLCQRLFFSTFVSVFVNGFSSAIAVPGDTTEMAQQRLYESAIISDLTFSKSDRLEENDEGIELYNGRGQYDGGDVHYDLVVANDVSVLELAKFYYPNARLSFVRENSSALALIAALWGEPVSEDFARSRFTDELKDLEMEAVSQFYLGERYGYHINTMFQSSGETGIYTIIVSNHSQWESDVEYWRYCNGRGSKPGNTFDAIR